MIRPRKETEDILLSTTKNCKMITKKTHIKPEETLEFEIIKPRKTFHFNPPIQIEDDWMLGLIDLNVYNYIFDIREEHNKFEFYIFPDEKMGRVSYEKVTDEIEKDLEKQILQPPVYKTI